MGVKKGESKSMKTEYKFQKATKAFKNSVNADGVKFGKMRIKRNTCETWNVEPPGKETSYSIFHYRTMYNLIKIFAMGGYTRTIKIFVAKINNKEFFLKNNFSRKTSNPKGIGFFAMLKEASEYQ